MTVLQAMAALAKRSECGRVPTTGILAFHSGSSYAETQRELRNLEERGLVTQKRHDRETFVRWSLTAEGEIEASK